MWLICNITFALKHLEIRFGKGTVFLKVLVYVCEITEKDLITAFKSMPNSKSH